MTKRSVLCLSSRSDQLEQILDALLRARLADCEISVLYPSLQDASLPGLEPLLESGPVVAALRQPGARASSDALVEMLIELGMSEDAARLHAARVKAGEVLVSVRCEEDDDLHRVRAIFDSAGASLVEDQVR